MTIETTKQPTDLRARWERLHDERPGLRTRDASAELGVSEAELVAVGAAGEATRLDADWPTVLDELQTLGRVVALTRNDAAVHEKTGEFGPFEQFGRMGQVVTEHIDLRIFLNAWSIGFAVERQLERRIQRSFQFFDGHGTAVHKVFVRPGGNEDAWRSMRDRHAADADAGDLEIEPPPEPSEPERTDHEVDVAALRRDWEALENTHQFHGMLREHEVGRTQALRLVGDDLARPVGRHATRHVLQAVAESGLSIMLFVGNDGTIQIHSGPVKKLKETEGWYNVLDPTFNLHLREGLIDSTWVVRKPTDAGTVTSLELYDADGENIALLFSKRPRGEREPEAWRSILADV